MNALPHLSVMTVSGSDARSFLHNQLSADIANLQAGDSTFACYCHPNGRVIALLLVWSTADRYRLLCSRELTDSTAARLRMFVLRDDVTIDIQVDQAVFGKRSVEARCTQPLDGFIYGLEDGETVPVDVFRAAELERGITWLDRASTEQFLPQMLGLDGIAALNFRKGCFPGQEIVARMRYLGKLKRRACVARLDRDVDWSVGQQVVLAPGGQTAEVVQGLPHPAGGSVVVLVVRTIEPVEVNHIADGEESMKATVHWLGGNS